MALVPCRECKKEVSSDADICPYCGASGPSLTGNGLRIFQMIVVSCLFLACSWIIRVAFF